MQDELLDLVNDKDEIIGTVWKSQAHKDPTLIHREVAIVLFNERQEVLLQQRSMSKSVEPGEWKVTAAGHVGVGEAMDIAVVRELQEELGIKVKPTFFNKVFRSRDDSESRFFWNYYALVKGRIPCVLDKTEVMDTAWVSVKALEEFAKTHNYDLNSSSHQLILELARKLFAK